MIIKLFSKKVVAEMTLGRRIVTLRRKKGWSQRELARRVNLNVSVMNRIELDDRAVKDHELARLANVLDTTTDFLLGFYSENKSEQALNSSLVKINEFINKLGMENINLFDISKWKKLSPEDIKEVKNHFEWVVHKAEERKWK